MDEYAILFLYYGGAPRDVLAANLSRLRGLNPGASIIPLIHDGDPFVHGTVDVRRYPCPWDATDAWASCDTMIYRWFPERAVRARRYIVCEWDTYATISVPAFYANVWDADVAAVEIVSRQETPDWLWFRYIPWLGALAEHATGLTPFSGTLFSAAALEAICGGPVIRDAFCELRVATLATHAGVTLTPMPFARRFISHDRSRISVSDAPGIYHPVKELMPSAHVPDARRR
jgi:hypothetical protein